MRPSPFLDVPVARADRWRMLRSEIERWYGALGESDGYAPGDFDRIEGALDIVVPVAFKEWYAVSARRRDIWSLQDELLPPDCLCLADGFLIFCMENQSVVYWGLRSEELGEADPPVYVQSAEDPPRWLVEEETVSLFALKWFLFCLKWSGNHKWTCGRFPEAAIVEIVSDFPALPFRPSPWTGSRFHACEDVVLDFEASNHGYISCLHEEDHDRIRERCLELGYQENANWRS